MTQAQSIVKVYSPDPITISCFYRFPFQYVTSNSNVDGACEILVNDILKVADPIAEACSILTSGPQKAGGAHT